MSLRPKPVVAIDGPAGAGKSTTARAVARALGYTLVDTGAIYRAVAYAALDASLALDDADALGTFAMQLVTRPRLTMRAAAGAVPLVLLDDRALGDEIRTPEVSMAASRVSRHAGVRAALLDLQRGFGAQGAVVLEGRDIGTVVFPDAEVKVFLTASDAARAERRHQELVGRGSVVPLEAVLNDVRTRDASDSERDVAPLRAAPDSVQIDSTASTVDDVVAMVVALARRHERG